MNHSSQHILNTVKLAAKVFHVVSKEIVKTASKIKKLSTSNSTSSSTATCDCTFTETSVAILLLMAALLFIASISAIFYACKAKRKIARADEVRMERLRFYDAAARHEHPTNSHRLSAPSTATSTPAHWTINETSGIGNESHMATVSYDVFA